MDGKFVPENPGNLFPLIRSSLNQKIIVGLYNPQIISMADQRITSIDIVNASGEDEIFLDLKYDLKNCRIKIRNCKGELIEEREMELDKGLHAFHCPSSGLIEIVELDNFLKWGY